MSCTVVDITIVSTVVGRGIVVVLRRVDCSVVVVFVVVSIVGGGSGIYESQGVMQYLTRSLLGFCTMPFFHAVPCGALHHCAMPCYALSY